MAGRDEWQVAPSHFAERFQLFVIIALGESLVAIGSGATGPRDAALAGIGVSLLGVIALWFAYFDWIARGAEGRLTRAQGMERSHLARDMYTFFHFPIAAGIIFFAVAAKKTLGHPGDPLSGAGRWALALGVSVCLLGFVVARSRAVHLVAWERAAGAAASLLCVAVVTGIDAILLLALVIGILGAVVVVESVSPTRVQTHACRPLSCPSTLQSMNRLCGREADAFSSCSPPGARWASAGADAHLAGEWTAQASVRRGA